MSIMELGALGEFFGSIGVIATLIYLVLQVRQNTQSIRSQSRFSVLETLNSDMRQLQTKECQELQTAVLSREASDEERNRWGFILAGWLSYSEMLYYELADGAIPKDFETSLRWRVSSIFTNLGAIQVWQLMKEGFTPKFRGYVDGLLANAPGTELERQSIGVFPEF